MSYERVIDEEKDAIIEQIVSCDICRRWLAYCMVTKHHFEETAEREAYWNEHGEHIKSCAGELGKRL
jgi:hypothetical protein